MNVTEASSGGSNVLKLKVKVIVLPVTLSVVEDVILSKYAPEGPPETYVQIQVPHATLKLFATVVPLIGDPDTDVSV